MSEEAKIRIGVDGAHAAKQELREVAEAGREVAGAAADGGVAAQTMGKGQKSAAKAASEWTEQNRTLAQRLKALGPEFAILGALVEGLTLKKTLAASAVGVLGVAVLGVTMLMQKYTAAQSEQKQAAAKLLEDLAGQKRAYDSIAVAVEAVNQSEFKRSQAIRATPPGPLIREVADIGARHGFGSDTVKGIAQIAAAGETIAAEDVETLSLWYALGYGNSAGSPEEARQMFFYAKRRDGSLRATLQGDMESYRERMGAGFISSQRSEAIEILSGTTAAAQAPQILKAIAERETLEGRPRTGEDIERWLGSLAGWLIQEAGYRYGGDKMAGKAASELRDILQSYPEAGELPFGPKGRFTSRAQVREDGATIINLISQMNQGGTVINQNDKYDPAGRPDYSRSPE